MHSLYGVVEAVVVAAANLMFVHIEGQFYPPCKVVFASPENERKYGNLVPMVGGDDPTFKEFFRYA